MSGKQYKIALRIEPGIIRVGDAQTEIELPEGCVGIALVFKDEISMVTYYGELIDYATVEEK